jgi:hypothetical protein
MKLSRDFVLKLKIINGGEGEPLLQSFTILLTGCIQLTLSPSAPLLIINSPNSPYQSI